MTETPTPQWSARLQATAEHVSGLYSSYYSRPRSIVIGGVLAVSLVVHGASQFLHMYSRNPFFLSFLWFFPTAAIGTGGLETLLRRHPGRSRSVLAVCLCLAVPAFLISVFAVAVISFSLEPLSVLDFGPQDALVYPGGESLHIRVTDGGSIITCVAHVAFYIGDGQALIAGHAMDLTRPGDEYAASVTGAGVSDQTTIRVTGSYDVGQVVLGLPLPARDAVGLAATDQIRTGEAQVIIAGRSVPVMIQGALASPGRPQMLAVTFVQDRMMPGHSGAPLIQDGRLVGVMVGSLALQPRVALARPAAEVYERLLSKGR